MAKSKDDNNSKNSLKKEVKELSKPMNAPKTGPKDEIIENELCPFCHEKTLTLMDKEIEVPYLTEMTNEDLKQFTNLTSLAIFNKNITDISCLTNLEHLNMVFASNQLSKECVESLPNLKTLKCKNEFRISKNVEYL